MHGKAKFKFSLYTVSFGIYNNYIQIPGYSDLETEEEFIKLMKKDKELGTFEGEFKYGLANGYGELICNNGLSYKGNWLNGYPFGSGIKIYDDGREENGEFGILDEGTLKLMTDYVEEKNGIFLNGTRRYANGDSEKVDKKTLYQTTKSKIKDFIE